MKIDRVAIADDELQIGIIDIDKPVNIDALSARIACNLVIPVQLDPTVTPQPDCDADELGP